MPDAAVSPPVPTEAAAPAQPARCLNCGAALAAPRPRYCGSCGQETLLKPPTLMEFAQQLGGSVMSTEGALWRTLALLLRRPGALTVEYLRGRRRHYVLPLRLYLTISVLAMLAVRLADVVTVNVPELSAVAPGQASLVVIDFGARRAGLDHGRFYCEQLPGWVCERLARRLDLSPGRVQRELADLRERFVGHWGTVMFLMLPLYAVLMKLTYWGRGLRYSEHLVFSLHLHAFWFLALALAVTPWPLLAKLAALAMPAYAFAAARRVYGGPWWGTALRGLVIVCAYGLLLAGAMVAVLAWAILG